MIDPKFNEIPVDPGTASTQTARAMLTDAEEDERLSRARAGLSINDTIAGDSMLSLGSRGVDVSGVEAGAGAGAGSTMLTPGRSSSPAPELVPDGRAIGTTAGGSGFAADTLSSASGVDAGANSGTGADETVADPDLEVLDDYVIAQRAYECWCERGQPHGSPEVDWHRAVADLRGERSSKSAPELQTSVASA